MAIRINKNIHYLYRHIRLDTNEVFYVGIGTVNKNESISSHERYYRRAYNNSKRNIFWKRVVSKTTYEVEILLESDDYDFIKQKEIEFISLYGRRDLGKGTLVNLTDGGENCGFKRSQESIQKQKDYYKITPHPSKGIPRTEETKDKLRKACKRFVGELNYFYGKRFTGKDHPLSKKVINIMTLVEYDSIKEAAEKENYNYSTLKSKLSKSNNNTNLLYYDDYKKLSK